MVRSEINADYKQEMYKILDLQSENATFFISAHSSKCNAELQTKLYYMFALWFRAMCPIPKNK